MYNTPGILLIQDEVCVLRVTAEKLRTSNQHDHVYVHRKRRHVVRVEVVSILCLVWSCGCVTLGHFGACSTTVIMREMALGANGFQNIYFLYFFAHPGAISPMGAISRMVTVFRLRRDSSRAKPTAVYVQNAEAAHTIHTTTVSY